MVNINIKRGGVFLSLAVFLLTTFLMLSSLDAAAIDTAWTYDSGKIEMDVRVQGQIDVKSSSVLKYVNANVSYIPLNYDRQTVSDKKYYPAAPQDSEQNIEFSWESPSAGIHDFRIDSTVTGFNKVPEIKGKIAFPYSSFPDEYIKYTKPSEMIDSDNPQIVNKASQLAAGEDDYYVVVFKLAEWTERNINYSLNTLTADVSQKSS